MIVQHQSTKVGHANTGLVALPGILRAGDTAESAHISSGSLQTTQFAQKSHLAHAGHRLATVSWLLLLI